MAHSSLRVVGFAMAAGSFVSSVFAGGVIVSVGALVPNGLSDAAAVNSGGQVVGSSNNNLPSFSRHAYLYTAAENGTGALVDLGTFGGSDSGAGGINVVGDVVGSAKVNGDVAYRAFYRASGGTLQSLGTLGGSNSFAAAVNSFGQVVGEAETDFFGYRAFRTEAAGGAMSNLGTLGGQFSSAKAINDSGQVAGGSYLTPDGANQFTRAFRYTGTPGFGGAMVDLGTLGGPNSFGYGINNAGVVVGEADVSYDINTGDRVTRAFRYTGTPGAGGVMTDLGTLGGINSDARSINNYGHIVGRSEINAEGDTHAFLYANGQMIDLDAWLNTSNVPAGLNWELKEANSISDTGYIAGTGVFNTPFGLRGNGYRLDAISLIGLPGDANRDRTVNFDDLLTLAQNYGATSAVWDNGDFNSDGVVGFDDLLTLAQRYGTSGLSTDEMSILPTTFTSDWAAAQSLVPEPASLSLSAVAAMALRRRRLAK